MTGTAGGRLRLVTIADRLLDVGVAVFAGWTISYHLALVFGVGRTVAVVMGVVLAAAAIVFLPGAGAARESSPDETPASHRTPAIGGAIVVAGLAAARSGLFWPAAFGYSLLMVRSLPAWRAAADRRHRSAVAAAWVLCLAVLSGLLSASVVQWTTDDSYYVNRALVVAESDAPFPFGVDTMHSDGDFPSAEPDNDLASWHPLAGLAAMATGTSPRWVISLVLQPLVAAGAVLAVWRAAAMLGARRPALAATAAFVVAFFIQRGPRSVWRYMWATASGRSMAATLVVPLVLAYAIEAGRNPSVRRGVLIALGCVAGVGATGSVVLAIPPLLVAALATAWPRRPRREMMPVWIGAAVGVGYVIAVTVAALVASSDLPATGVQVGSVVDQWISGVVGVFAPWWLIGAVTLAIFLVPAVAPPTARRFAILAFVVLFAFVISPLAFVYTGKGATTVFRGTWAVVPMVLVALAVDGLARVRWGPPLVGGLVLAAAASGWMIRLEAPAPDLPRDSRVAAARTLARIAPSGSVVAGPFDTLSVVPALGREVFPLAAEVRFAITIDAVDPSFGGAERLELVEAFTSGVFPGAPERLAFLLDRFDVRAVQLTGRAHDEREIRVGLRLAGFEVVARDGRRTFWSR